MQIKVVKEKEKIGKYKDIQKIKKKIKSEKTPKRKIFSLRWQWSKNG